MNLTHLQSVSVISAAVRYIGKSYTDGFRCVDFVRIVYRECGIELPLLTQSAPPKNFNISKDMLENPPPGALVFLKDPRDPRNRVWTHVAIVLPEKKFIHCSIFFGRKVVVSTYDEIFAMYEFAPSEIVT